MPFYLAMRAIVMPSVAGGFLSCWVLLGYLIAFDPWVADAASERRSRPVAGLPIRRPSAGSMLDHPCAVPIIALNTMVP